MDVENEIKNLKHALEVQKVTNSLLLIMRTVDVLSPKGHVFEVLKLVAEEQKGKRGKYLKTILLLMKHSNKFF
ncbi:hypothetical protein CS369_20890 [Candidatus Symbiopectobacterium sp. 'North America']|uniref:hypothetical protein n=1 Tax=Candidatus Symbiopectobacterium sp. 'North America' TaxID=2794574 RepID=UPI0018CB1637|nr:hypothetical protein [Candidatus Symbiopectobacterium sp. 'North America']MBG6246568.1 hypothetical protein [Candidatus Symbiopectobacterium sp. 'North America']